MPPVQIPIYWKLKVVSFKTNIIKFGMFLKSVISSYKPINVWKTIKMLFPARWKNLIFLSEKLLARFSVQLYLARNLYMFVPLHPIIRFKAFSKKIFFFFVQFISYRLFVVLRDSNFSYNHGSCLFRSDGTGLQCQWNAKQEKSLCCVDVCDNFGCLSLPIQSSRSCSQLSSFFGSSTYALSKIWYSPFLKFSQGLENCFLIINWFLFLSQILPQGLLSTNIHFLFCSLFTNLSYVYIIRFSGYYESASYS